MTQLTLARSAGVRLRLLALIPLIALAAPLAQSAAASNPPASASAASSQRVMGIDVSKYQHDTGKAIDWQRVKASGQRFAFIKATGGSNRIDPWFTREWAGARRAGMITGAYHYANPGGSAIAQARLIVSVVGTTREANNLGIVLDLESTGGLGPARLALWAKTFLREVQRLTGRLPILYTGPNFWNGKVRSSAFGAHPLWLARYNSVAPAPLPGWDRWTFWQYTSSGRVPGIPGHVDRNWFCCTVATLRALADGRSLRITRVWSALGGASGRLGLPIGPEKAIPGGWGQVFERGFVSATGRGHFAVTDPLWDRYKANGGATGALGVPLAQARVVSPGVTEQRFAGGHIVHATPTGAFALTGDVLDRWATEGGATGGVGLPVAEATATGQQFTGGGLYRTPDGVRHVPGAIRDHYEELGGPASFYGLPKGEAYDVLGGRAVDFALGQLIEYALGGQKVVV